MAITMTQSTAAPSAQPQAMKKTANAVGSSSKRTEWKIASSAAVARSKNPIRTLIAKAMATPPPASALNSKPLINLGLGDPTIFGLHPASPIAIQAMHEALDSGKGNGYTNGPGSAEARAAVAEYHERWDKVKYGVDDITLSHGAGQALEVIFASLVSPHSNVLLPRPGFHQYETLLANIGAECRFYDCVEENDWEIDLASLESLIDENSAMILIINPSNPCGSNFSKSHLQDLLAVAEAHKLPIVADEIYGHMNWGSKPFTPLAAISETVPIITVSGLSKRFLLPGWRFGWILLHDPKGLASAAKEAFHIWQNRFMGPGATMQLALPKILKEVDSDYFDAIVAKLERNARGLNEAVNAIPGVRCRFPEASMYLLMGIDVAKFGFKDDVEFSAAFYQEEACFLLPGMCFDIADHLRIVTAVPYEVCMDMATRLKEFCARHYRD